jgi:hypothetical protein
VTRDLSESPTSGVQLPATDGLPNLIVAGAVKAGTTSLFTYLASHPQVLASSVKETLFFSPARYREPVPPLDEYREYFRGWSGEPVVMEASPGYLYGGELVARPIKDSLGDIMVVVVLREPVSRLESFFSFYKEKGVLPADMSLADYVSLCDTYDDEDFFNRDLFPYHGVAGSHYDRFMQGWIDTFGTNVHVLFFDDLAKDPRAVLLDIACRTGLDPEPLNDTVLSVENRTVAYRRRTLHRAALEMNRRVEPVLRRYPALKRTLRSSYQAVNTTSRERSLPSELQASLEERFRPSNARLVEQLKGIGVRSFPEWLQAR